MLSDSKEMAESYRLASAGGDVKVWDMPGNVLWKTLVVIRRQSVRCVGVQCVSFAFVAVFLKSAETIMLSRVLWPEENARACKNQGV